jgi:hypothetical protein
MDAFYSLSRFSRGEMPPTNGFIQIGSTYLNGARFHGSLRPANAPGKDGRRSISATQTQRRQLLDLVSMGHERQHIPERPLFRIRIQPHNNNVFSVSIHRFPHERNQTSLKELRLVDHNCCRRLEISPP